MMNVFIHLSFERAYRHMKAAKPAGHSPVSTHNDSKHQRAASELGIGDATSLQYATVIEMHL